MNTKQYNLWGAATTVLAVRCASKAWMSVWGVVLSAAADWPKRSRDFYWCNSILKVKPVLLNENPTFNYCFFFFFFKYRFLCSTVPVVRFVLSILLINSYHSISCRKYADGIVTCLKCSFYVWQWPWWLPCKGRQMLRRRLPKWRVRRPLQEYLQGNNNRSQNYRPRLSLLPSFYCWCFHPFVGTFQLP